MYRELYSTVRSIFVKIGSRFVRLATVSLSLFAARSSHEWHRRSAGVTSQELRW